MLYDDDLIIGKVSKRIRKRTQENMEVYFMGLYDSFNEAVKTYGQSKELKAAFYYDDYRKFIPSAYCPEYLDFSKYPLKYHI